MKIKIITSALLVVTVITACAVAKKNKDVMYVKHGLSYGKCQGYCYKEDTYTNDDFVNYQRPNRPSNEFPEKLDSTTIELNEWKSILKNINLTDFYKQPATIGCPGCTDGGSEWIEIATSDKVYRVTFEEGKPSEALKPIYSALRKL
ncbi:MAG: hypothetical protein RI922_222 [Bacteroidota bacterium]|jgi:hypothetical protein